MTEPRTGTISIGTIHTPKGHSHLYEIDLIRAVTAFCVVGVHVVAFTVILTNSPLGELAQYAVKSALHFTREIFLSITAFVMVIAYANRPLSARVFWRRRGIGVLLPYVVWSLFYDWTNHMNLPPLQWTAQAAQDLLTGKASYQLYFILLTLEFYLILPLFLPFIKRTASHPWWLLGISLGLQIGMLSVDYFYVQLEPFASTWLGHFIDVNQDSFLPLYQFYLVLGGLAAHFLPELRAFMLRHGAWTIGAVVLTILLLWGDLWYQTDVTHRGLDYGSRVFQPAMALYALAVTAFLYWIAYRWAVRRAPHPPHWYKFWGFLSSISFGIYLMHVYILNNVLVRFVPALPIQWPEPLRVMLTWVVVASITCVLCSVMLYTPILSLLIGRPCALPSDRGVGAWFSITSSTCRRALRRATNTAWELVAVPTVASRAWLTWSDSPLARVSKSSAEAKIPPNALPKATEPERRCRDTGTE